MPSVFIARPYENSVYLESEANDSQQTGDRECTILAGNAEQRSDLEKTA